MESSRPREGKNKNRTVTVALVAAACVSFAGGLAIGINDNLPGLALVYLGVAALILAFAHTWRRVRNFLTLLAASLIGFPVFVVLHNLLYALGELASDMRVLGQVLDFLEVAFFLLAVLVCPPGALIGAVGSVVVVILQFRRKRMSGEMP